ncbi:MAG: 4Fe-4S cluster-binding domain-containing protein [Candidatus Methanomethylicaceae archaeon]
MELRVVETFISIQGESTYAGKVCHFVRLHGCNLNCTYCDTEYARKGRYSAVASDYLLPELINSPAPVIEFTGGEPLLQLDAVVELCRKLTEQTKKVILIETNGTISVEPFRRAPRNVVLVVDCKTPSSGHSTATQLMENLRYLRKTDQIKFVVGNQDDLIYSKILIDELGLASKFEVLISPIMPYNADFLHWLVKKIESDLPLCRLQLQLHKIIGVR